MEHIKTCLPNKKETCRFLAIAIILCLCVPVFMLSNMEVAFCDPTTPTGNAANMADSVAGIVTSGTSKLYIIIRSIVIPVLILIISVNGLTMMGGNPQSMENAKKKLIWAFIGSTVVVFSPQIGQEVGNWLNSSSTFGGDLGSYNPLKK